MNALSRPRPRINSAGAPVRAVELPPISTCWAPALAAQHEGVTVHGYVADTLPFWTSATALAVPILSGGGVRVKILEAMAMGVPLVSTTVG